MMEYLVITRVDHSLSVDFGKVGFGISLLSLKGVDAMDLLAICSNHGVSWFKRFAQRLLPHSYS